MKFGIVVDLFCGVGGLLFGFEKVGFIVLVGNDMMVVVGKMFEVIYVNVKFLYGEI